MKSDQCVYDSCFLPGISGEWTLILICTTALICNRDKECDLQQTKTNTVSSHLHVECNRDRNRNSYSHRIKEQNGAFSSGARCGGNGEMLVKGYKHTALRWISSGVLMYSVMTVIPDYIHERC